MNKKTVTIQIGNSDNKLTQARWAEFIRHVDIFLSPTKTYFRGFSVQDEVWQNACWVVEIEDYEYDAIKRNISRLVSLYEQDSIAWTYGYTELINE